MVEYPAFQPSTDNLLKRARTLLVPRSAGRLTVLGLLSCLSVCARGLGSRMPGGVELELRDTGAVLLIPYVPVHAAL